MRGWHHAGSSEMDAKFIPDPTLPAAERAGAAAGVRYLPTVAVGPP